jgi:hypothetical protein
VPLSVSSTSARPLPGAITPSASTSACRSAVRRTALPIPLAMTSTPDPNMTPVATRSPSSARAGLGFPASIWIRVRSGGPSGKRAASWRIASTAASSP